MAPIFLILGYGVPRDILKDEHYSFYLKMAFNSIYDIYQKNAAQKTTIIFCGGKTDCFKPYTRTEAGEMARFMKSYLTPKKYLKDFLKTVVFLEEKKGLSSLDNFLEAKNILSKRRIKGAIYVVCEKTRERKIRTLATKVFAKNNPRVMTIDFDISKNRYLDPQFLFEKEKKTLLVELKALNDKQFLKKYHTLLKKKILYLRSAGSGRQVEAVKQWWEEQLLRFDTIDG